MPMLWLPAGRRERLDGGAVVTTPASKLTRIAFITSRLVEYFTESELGMQIGHKSAAWPIALLKELIDNALDACEAAGIAPEITITVEPDAVTVADNGPGLPESVLRQSLDYRTRTSDKALYVSPSRGQLGNALKTVWAAPFVIDGEAGRVEVATGGKRFSIDVRLDRLANEPRIELWVVPDADVKTGTAITMHWPGIASSLFGKDHTDFYNVPTFAKLLADYIAFNPHLTLRCTPAWLPQWQVPDLEWQKWAPCHPTDPHWYTPVQLERLIAAHLVADDEGRQRTVREFVAEFAGLSGTGKQKAVTDAVGLTGATLADLLAHGELDSDRVLRLLRAMQDRARPVRAKALGLIGDVHLSDFLTAWKGCAPNSIRYANVAANFGEIPYVLEVALGIRDADATQRRSLSFGVNWSALLGSPSAQLTELLGEVRVDSFDPVAVVVHLASPVVQFTDRGKTRLALVGPVMDALERSVRNLTKAWTGAKRQVDRQQRVVQHNLEALRRQAPKELSIKDAAYAVMQQAYLAASDNETLPANARQIMYAARPLVLERTGGRCWKTSNYFTQDLLSAYLEEHPEERMSWDIVYDARGHFREPHTDRRVDLGTMAVRDYIGGWRNDIDPSLEAVVQTGSTLGPANRYRFVLFIEKEGFDPLLDRANIADRFDLGLMSTKGMSVTAARRLVDELAGLGVTVLVLHDFDKSGLTILRTLGSDSRRYGFTNTPKIVDLGLRFPDVEAMHLESEPVSYDSKIDPRFNLRDCGATAEECEFLVDADHRQGWHGQRVELNAMTSRQFIDFLEGKLAAAGAEKLIPDDDQLASAYRREVQRAQLQAQISQIFAAQGRQPAIALPADLRKQVQAEIDGTDLPWDVGVWRVAQQVETSE
jgi:DNA topoisomerase VI subunit B